MPRVTLIAAVTLLLTFPARADDWPQFRGANRQGKSAETGLLARWPVGGPKRLWTVTGLGQGYSSPTIAGDRVYVTGMLDSTGHLFAFDRAGKALWKVAYGPETDGAGYPGARSSPTVDGDRLYITSGMGLVACHDARTGKRVWSFDLLTRFGVRNPRWGISESVLIDGDHAIICPGGPKAMAALDKRTGKTVWTTRGVDLPTSYTSPVLMERAGRRLVLAVYNGAILAVDRADGAVLWRHPFKQVYGVLCVSPVVRGDLLFTAAGYTGSTVLRVAADGRSAAPVWQSKAFDITHGGAVEVDGHLYGTSTRRPKTQWMCVEMATGKVKWQAPGVGKGSVIAADGMLYCYGETSGVLALVKADPGGYQAVSQFTIDRGSGWHWGHPAIAGRRLFLRHGDALMCFGLAADD